LAAEAASDPGEGGVVTADSLLREYLSGDNDRQLAIDRTTPLFRDNSGKVFYMLPGNQVCHPERCHTLMPILYTKADTT